MEVSRKSAWTGGGLWVRARCMLRRTSYRVRLASAFALLGLIAPLGLGALVGDRVSRDLREHAGGDIATMARQLAHNLDYELAHLDARTQILAESLHLHDAFDPATIRRALSKFQRLTSEIVWVGYAQPDGTVVAATDGLLEGRSIRERPVFQEARRSAYLGGLHPAKLLERHLGDPGRQEPLRLIDVGVPVRDPKTGHLHGVIAVHISWEWAREVRQRLLSTTEASSKVAFTILSQEGEVLLSPAPPPVLGETGPRIGNVVREVAAAPGEQPWHLVDSNAREDIVASLQTSQAGLGWHVLAWQPADHAFARARQAWRTALAFASGAAVLSGLLGWYLGYRMGAPVLKLASAARGIRAGRQTRLPSIQGPRELASLSGALNDLLASLRRESSLQVRNATLQRERSAAERASRAKSTFLANMNHELRTPLNAVMGFAQMMRHDPKTPLPDVHAERVEQIELAGQHLLMVISDVLATAQAEAGELKVASEELDLAKVLCDSLALVGPVAQEAGVTLPDALPETPMPVIADPLRTRQILVNLLSNAVKYNDRAGSVGVQIQRDGDLLQLSIIDDGPGVDPKRVDALFEPFNRGDARTAGKEGIGLGLPLSRMLAERMAGRLELENGPQGGAIARLSLPAADS